MPSERRSLAEIVGPWQQPPVESGLIERVRSAWSKPIATLTNHELATCLRQSIAIDALLQIAKERVRQCVDDESEIDDEELARAVEETEYREKREQTHQQIIAARFHTDDPKG